jgi:hypothetical protein
MPRKIKIREFCNPDGEFGFAVEVFCRDRKTLLTSRVFSATPIKNHYILRSYGVKPPFLRTSASNEREKAEDLVMDYQLARQRLRKQARTCYGDFRTSYRYVGLKLPENISFKTSIYLKKV